MDEISASYSIMLLALSFIIAVFGSFTALQLAIRIPVADKQALGFWVLSSGIALGGGAIWSMHFIGMLAMNMPFPMQLDFGLTFLSFIIAIIFVSLGLVVAGRDLLGEASLVLGGAIAGIGAASMHYLGMYAMKIPASITYDSTLVAVSVVIAIVAATVSLWLAFNLRGALQRFGSAIIMGIAVCGMHYTGMYAATMTPNEGTSPVSLSGNLSASGLATTVTVVTVVLLFVMLYLSYTKTKKVRQLA